MEPAVISVLDANRQADNTDAAKSSKPGKLEDNFDDWLKYGPARFGLGEWAVVMMPLLQPACH
jgi:hypothetical protein